jgi:hypothetical protein
MRDLNVNGRMKVKQIFKTEIRQHELIHLLLYHRVQEQARMDTVMNHQVLLKVRNFLIISAIISFSS